MTNSKFAPRIRCAAVTSKGQPCRAWAVLGTDPPCCVAHGGGSGKHGAPKGNRNALKHGFYAEAWQEEPAMKILDGLGQDIAEPVAEGASPAVDEKGYPAEGYRSQNEKLQIAIESVIEDMYAKLAVLSHYIDRHMEDMTMRQYTHLFTLYGQMASRLGRLLRDDVAIMPEGQSEMDRLYKWVYEGLSDRLGVNLTADRNYVPKTTKQT